jgi:hypothetical protein
MEPTLRSNYESYAPSTPREREAARRFGTLAQLCFKPEPLRRGQICPDQAGQESSDVVLRALERSGLAYLDSAGIWQPTGRLPSWPKRMSPSHPMCGMRLSAHFAAVRHTLNFWR